MPDRAAQEHKTGRAIDKPKIIPLPAMALEILAAMTPGKPEELVIRSAKEGARVDLKKAWARVRAAAGLPKSNPIQLRHWLEEALILAGIARPGKNQRRAYFDELMLKPEVIAAIFDEASRVRLPILPEKNGQGNELDAREARLADVPL